MCRCGSGMKKSWPKLQSRKATQSDDFRITVGAGRPLRNTRDPRLALFISANFPFQPHSPHNDVQHRYHDDNSLLTFGDGIYEYSNIFNLELLPNQELVLPTSTGDRFGQTNSLVVCLSYDPY